MCGLGIMSVGQRCFLPSVELSTVFPHPVDKCSGDVLCVLCGKAFLAQDSEQGRL